MKNCEFIYQETEVLYVVDTGWDIVETYFNSPAAAPEMEISLDGSPVLIYSNDSTIL